MCTGRLAVAAAVTAAGAAGLARAAAPPPAEVSVSIAGPRAAEISTWTDLRVDVVNLGTDPQQVHVTVTLPLGRARPAEAAGGRCSGAGPMECEQSVAAAGTGSLAIPVRWDGYGNRTIEVRARPESGAPDVAATGSVSVYLLRLRGLRTSPARAGRRFVATATLARSDTGAPLRARSLRCLAVTAAVPRGRPLSSLRGTGAISGARLTCSWLVPARERGRYVRALVLADTHPGGMLTKYPFVRRVR
jgi:hypothetical protein